MKDTVADRGNFKSGETGYTARQRNYTYLWNWGKKTQGEY